MRGWISPFSIALAPVVALAAGCSSSSSTPESVLSPYYKGAAVVVEGKPPLAFIYPGSGLLAIEDVDTQSMIVSMNLPEGQSMMAPIRITATEVTAGDTNDRTVLLSGIAASHVYRIFYRPASPAHAEPTTAP